MCNDMGFSKLYHSLLSMKFFVDLRQVDALSMLFSKYLERDVNDFTAEKYSDEHPLEPKMVAASIPSMSAGGQQQSEGRKIAIIPLHGNMIKYGTMCAYGADEIAEAIDIPPCKHILFYSFIEPLAIPCTHASVVDICCFLVLEYLFFFCCVADKLSRIWLV